MNKSQKTPEIDVATARTRLDAEGSVFVDIRDPGSYAAGHIPGALNLGDHNVQDFLATADRGTPLVVYCYHGISSLGATSFFIQQGFEDVASMSGGFSAWPASHPTDRG